MPRFLIGLACAALGLGNPVAAQEMAHDSANVPTSGEIVELAIPSVPGVVIAGTLRLPKGQGTGPFPLVISMSGDGPNPRGAYHLLSERLLAEGIATFEYDKRGSGASTGTFAPLLTDAAEDGRAVFDALHADPRIDPARIAVTGHSEGAAAAPMFLRDRDDLAAFVSLAGPAGKRGQMFRDSLAASLVASGKDVEKARAAGEAVGAYLEGRIAASGETEMALLRAAAVAAFEQAGFDQDAAQATLASIDTQQIRQMYDLDPSDNLSRMRAPVLMVYGSRDLFVRPETSVEPAVDALRANPDAAVVTIGGVDHWLIRSEDGEARPDMGWPVSAPEVLDLVTGWLVRRLRPAER